jgi:hypothetical protein
MGGIDFRLMCSEVDMATVLKLLGFVPSHRRGDQVRGPCPLHWLRRPGGPHAGGRSFSAHLRRNVYQCFHCGSRGNQLDLWAAATGQPLYQAATDLCGKLHLPLPRLRLRQTERKKSAPAS